MSNDVIEKLKSFCLSHPELMERGIIKGINSIDGKVVLEKNGVSKNISIEDLENNRFDFETFDFKKDENMDSNVEEIIEELDEPKEIQNNVNIDEVPTTLEEIENCVKNKEENLIDKALETFAIDEKTGNININKAIKIITDNSVNTVVNAVRDNAVLSTDLSNYDIMGNQINKGNISDNKVDVDKMIDDSFNNIMVYVEIAKLKNIIYNVDQIENAKNKYAISVKDKINILGLNKETETTSEEGQEIVNVTSDIKPDSNIKKAGFADILILTIIILIYAAIIINLITKLK